MRIIAGAWRGRRIAGVKGRGVRPTTDRVREAWMSIIADRLPGARVADLFAGSGALGLEALSRGAAHVTFVERSRRAGAVLARNIRTLGAGERVTTIRGDALAHARGAGRLHYDLALADPPYDHGWAARLLAEYRRSPFARELWIEHRSSEVLGEGQVAEQRRYGDTILSRATPPPASPPEAGEAGTSPRKAGPPGAGAPQAGPDENPDARRAAPAAGSLAVYPGSFDPVTRGHEDVARRSLHVCDRLIVAVAESPSQAKRGLFAVGERLAMIREVFADEPRIECRAFSGLLVDFVREAGACCIVRGLRAVSDFEYEFQMAQMNRELGCEAETIFFVPDVSYSFLSASLVREVALLGGDVSAFVSPPVLERLRAMQG